MAQKTKNQVHKPSQNYSRFVYDAKNKQMHEIKDLRKIYFKNKSGSSMLMFKDLKPEDAYTRQQALKHIYHDWRGEFIVTR